MDFLEKLNYLMQEKEINKNVLSKESGVPYTTIDGFYKKGYQNAKLSTIKKLAEYFNTTLDYLMRDEIVDKNYGKYEDFKIDYNEIDLIKNYRTLDNYGKKMIDTVMGLELHRIDKTKVIEFRKDEQKESTHTSKLKLSEQKASAGTGVFLGEESMVDIDVEFNYLTARADFAVPVDGDSMLPKYKNGDILLIHKQPAVNVGEIGIFIIDGKGYVKKQGSDRLISLNEDYEDIYPEENAYTKCCGKVIGILETEWIKEQ